MIIQFSEKARRQTQKLPDTIRQKFQKQLLLLRLNPRHPSLRARKMQGYNAFEARIDYHYRFAFVTEGDVIHVLAVGPHDTGLGKK